MRRLARLNAALTHLRARSGFMGGPHSQISLAEARALLGVASDAAPGEIRRAYLDAAKRSVAGTARSMGIHIVD